MQTKMSWQDVVMRVTLLAAGVVAALLFIQDGRADALAPLAFGGAVAACMIRGFASPEGEA